MTELGGVLPPLAPPLVLGALSAVALVVLATAGLTALRAALAPA